MKPCIPFTDCCEIWIMPDMYVPFTIWPWTCASWVKIGRAVSDSASPDSPATGPTKLQDPVFVHTTAPGLFSKISSHVRNVLGKVTTVFAGTRIMSLLICNHPPDVLQPAGVGGGGGATGVTTAPGVRSSGGVAGAGSHIASTDANWMKPRSSKPGATV